jgi:hypothetical protein
VIEHQLVGADGKTMIAQATIKKYRDIPREEADEAAETSKDVVYIPENIMLEWKREQLSLDVTVGDVALNQFDPSLRAGLFVEPDMSGYNRVNLAELTRVEKKPEGETLIRETIPAPASSPATRGRVRLGPPVQVKGDDSASRSSKSRRIDAKPDSPQEPELLPLIEELVTAPRPNGMNPEPDRTASSGWSSSGISIER